MHSVRVVVGLHVTVNYIKYTECRTSMPLRYITGNNANYTYQFNSGTVHFKIIFNPTNECT